MPDSATMAPAAVMINLSDNSEDFPSEELGSITLVDMASQELERLRKAHNKQPRLRTDFPPACLAMLRNIEGNHRCVDCDAPDPQWATISYGALLCLQCSGHHRSLGVQVSCVRSVTMDAWTLPEVVAMLEGGNSQLSHFFTRHALSQEGFLVHANRTITRDNVTRLRYKTKAAQFYRQQLEIHVCAVLQSGPYRGREISRNLQRSKVERRNSDP